MDKKNRMCYNLPKRRCIPVETIRNLMEKHKQLILYTLFGCVTVFSETGAFFICNKIIMMPASLSNVIGWVFGVTAAFLTNKPFVFRSHDWSRKTVLLEMRKFVGCRFGSGLFETIALGICSDIFGLDGFISKLVLSVFVIAFNYFAAQYYVFHAKKQD